MASTMTIRLVILATVILLSACDGGEHSDALADLVDEGATVVLAHTVPSEVATNQTH